MDGPPQRPDDSGIFTAVLRNASGSTKSSTNLNVVAESAAEGTEYVVSSAASSQTTRRHERTRQCFGLKIRLRILDIKLGSFPQCTFSSDFDCIQTAYTI